MGSRDELGMPKERRLTPDSPPPVTDDAADACEVRFLVLLRVTLLGMWWCPIALPLRGLARGGVLVGAGSLERAE